MNLSKKKTKIKTYMFISLFLLAYLMMFLIFNFLFNFNIIIFLNLGFIMGLSNFIVSSIYKDNNLLTRNYRYYNILIYMTIFYLLLEKNTMILSSIYFILGYLFVKIFYIITLLKSGDKYV